MKHTDRLLQSFLGDTPYYPHQVRDRSLENDFTSDRVISGSPISIQADNQLYMAVRESSAQPEEQGTDNYESEKEQILFQLRFSDGFLVSASTLGASSLVDRSQWLAGRTRERQSGTGLFITPAKLDENRLDGGRTEGFHSRTENRATGGFYPG